MRLSVRDALSRRTVKDLLHVRGIEVSHETLRVWWRRSGRLVAAEIRKRDAVPLLPFLT